MSIPPPFPDESLFSLVCRYHTASGNSSLIQTKKELTGVPNGLPFNEEETIKVIISLSELMGVSVASLVEKHTCMPYFEVFNRRKGIHGKKYYLMSLISLSRSFSGSLFCPKCVEHDISLYGVAYWHRSHEIRNAKLCGIHNELLMMQSYRSEQGVRADCKFPLPDPENIMYKKDIRSGAIDDNTLENEFLTNREIESELAVDETNNIIRKRKNIRFMLSKLSIEMMEESIPVLGHENIVSAYRVKLETDGFISSNGTFDFKSFKKYLIDIGKYKYEVLCYWIWNDIYTRHMNIDWFESMINSEYRSERRLYSYSSECHMVAIFWLFGSFKNFKKYICRLGYNKNYNESSMVVRVCEKSIV